MRKSRAIPDSFGVGAAGVVAATAPIGVSAVLRSRLIDYAALAKARLSLLVLVVAAVGYCFGSGASIDLIGLLHMLLGTGLVAAGANALNQYMERDFDRLMRRTADRPLPSGRVPASEGLLVGLVFAAGGLIHLAAFTNRPATLFAALTISLYLFAYTPLKRRTVWNTLVGAIPGALPPVIGYSAAHGSADLPAWLLFAIVYFWQLPHFYAIAWMYREDYARGGYRMISVDDADGRATGRQAVIYCLPLLAAGALPAMLGFSGATSMWGGILCAIPLLAAALAMAKAPSYATARRTLLTSLAYLPSIMVLLLVDRRLG